MWHFFSRFIDNDDDLFEEHQSVHKARLGQQQPVHVSLDDCLRLFTKDEKVSTGQVVNGFQVKHLNQETALFC